MKKEMDSSPKSEIILYQPNETVSLEVRLDEETVWLTLNQMSILFGRDKSVISRHIATIFKEEELEREATVAKNATVQNENGRTVLRTIELKKHSENFHDRFLIIDDVVYHFGASFKDLGNRLFAFNKMGLDKDFILSAVKSKVKKS